MTYYFSHTGWGCGEMRDDGFYPEGSIESVKYGKLFETEEEMLSYAIERTSIELHRMLTRKLKLTK